MKNLTNRIAMFAAGAFVLATMAYGQTVPVLKAEIPFAFRTASGTLPAGVYSVVLDSTHAGVNITALRDTASTRMVYTVGLPIDATKAGTPAVVFRCGEEGCTLRGIRTSAGTVAFNSGRQGARTKEVAVTAVTLRAVNGD